MPISVNWTLLPNSLVASGSPVDPLVRVVVNAVVVARPRADERVRLGCGSAVRETMTAGGLPACRADDIFVSGFPESAAVASTPACLGRTSS
jgi:hypothetical protein